jgi:hypothetical protein
MRPIGDRQPTALNKLTAPLQAAAAKPAPLPVPTPVRKLASLAADAVGIAMKARGFEAAPPVDLQSVDLPGGDYANNSTQSGASGTKGTARPGPRRADAGPSLEGQDFANNTTQAGTTGSPKPPSRPRRSDAGMSIQEIGEA